MSFISAILALGFLIFIHELGHFLLAKFCGVKVLEFAIGFGPVIFQRQWGETLYALRGIPLGGFVRMAGDTLQDCSEHEDASEEEKSRWFLTKGYWSKFAVVFAGPAFNLLGAVLIASLGIYFFGQPVLLKQAIIGDAIPEHPAAKAGLKGGDRVLSINGEKVSLWEELSNVVRDSNGKPLTFEVARPQVESPEDAWSGDSEVDDKVPTNVVSITVVPDKEITELDTIAGDTA
ncbi:MAG: site-2 protease family protein, partial [Bdellovibrionales bacterium]|nr:site-2 protease family protein [Bdellovibrionales bacterium]